jgi:hypothetical protein
MSRLLLLSALLLAPAALAQDGIAPSVTTDQAEYAYGETIEIRYTLANDGTTPFTVWGASVGCQAELIFDDLDFSDPEQVVPQLCTTDTRPYDFPPGASATWVWLIDPAELGLPRSDGTHTITAYFDDQDFDGNGPLTEETVASVTFVAPQYLGGRLHVILASGVTEDDVQDVLDALNAVILDPSTDPTIPEPEGDLWEISGTTLEEAAQIYSDDERFLLIEPYRYLAYESVIFTDDEDGAPPRTDPSLTAAHPNPFAASTSFALTVPESGRTRVEVFDVLGRRVAVLHDGPLAAGPEHRFTFHAADLPSGLYVVRASGEDFTQTRRITLSR